MSATVERIVSGGQTGVDRAALDAALACGIAVGGWCPKGRRAEDGAISAHYPLKETASARYTLRTHRNVIDSDGTLILAWGPPGGGTRRTVDYAQREARPWLIVDLAAEPPGRAVVERVRAWIAAHGIRILNVAGPRASQAPDAYAAAYALVTALLTQRA